MTTEELSEMAYGAYVRLRSLERNYAVETGAAVMFGAFALYLAQRNPGVTNLEKLLDAVPMSKNLRACVKNSIGEHWDAYLVVVNDFRMDELLALLSGRCFFDEAGRRSGYESSEPLAELVKSILSIDGASTVCDLGCGAGDFLISVAKDRKDLAGKSGMFVGVEINMETAALAELRCIVQDLPIEVSVGNVFEKGNPRGEFDRVFCMPPFSMKNAAMFAGFNECLRLAYPDFPEITPRAFGDWLFVARTAMALKEGGRAAVVLLPGSLFRGGCEESFRKFFVRRGLIEAVIQLPANLLSYTGLPVCVLILSSGNERVKMVDASAVCHRGRRGNMLRSDDVDQIVKMLNASAEKSMPNCSIASRDELLKDDCDLSVKKYITAPGMDFDGIPLADLVARVWRGEIVSSDELDRLVVDGKDEKASQAIRYVTPANVNDGLVDETLTLIRELPESFRGEDRNPYVQDGDILLCRVMSNGARGKTAIVELKDGERLLPNGNMIVLTIDRKLADPYFIKAYLDSDVAQSYLQDSSSSVQMLQVRRLEKIMVPKVPLEKQREIGEQCRQAIAEVKAARRALRSSMSRLTGLFDENCRDYLNER